MKLLCVILSLILAFSAVAYCEEAYFAFTTYRQREFVFKLTDSKLIDHARKIISKEEKKEVHVMGRIIKKREGYNPNYDYHLDPNNISFFENAIEVCDATTQYVDDHLDEACGAFLPGCIFCPWVSELTKEIKP
ncbi:hypothetical protein ACTA71_009947 [Dictyostelium dimigraforme]